MKINVIPEDAISKIAYLLIFASLFPQSTDTVSAAGEALGTEILPKDTPVWRGNIKSKERLKRVVKNSIKDALEKASCEFSDECKQALIDELLTVRNALEYLIGESSINLLCATMRDIVQRFPDADAEMIPFESIAADIDARIETGIKNDVFLQSLDTNYRMPSSPRTLKSSLEKNKIFFETFGNAALGLMGVVISFVGIWIGIIANNISQNQSAIETANIMRNVIPHFTNIPTEESFKVKNKGDYLSESRLSGFLAITAYSYLGKPYRFIIDIRGEYDPDSMAHAIIVPAYLGLSKKEERKQLFDILSARIKEETSFGISLKIEMFLHIKSNQILYDHRGEIYDNLFFDQFYSYYDATSDLRIIDETTYEKNKLLAVELKSMIYHETDEFLISSIASVIIEDHKALSKYLK